VSRPGRGYPVPARRGFLAVHGQGGDAALGDAAVILEVRNDGVRAGRKLVAACDLVTGRTGQVIVEDGLAVQQVEAVAGQTGAGV